MASIDVRIRARAGDQNIDEAAIEELKYSGGVRRDIERRANNVAEYQRSHVGVKTGELLGTIRLEDAGASIDVTAGRAGQTPQLGYHMYGTPSHEIKPRNPDGMLRFYWEKVGARVAFKRVSHPGGEATRFVQESIYAAID